MIDFEVKDIIEVTRIMNPYLDFDSSYNFYYDETNNIKKFHVKEEDFNYSFHSNFVLGGVLYSGARPNIEGMLRGLRLQPSVKEIKLKHIAKGEFIDCLRSDKLNYFLKSILDSSMYVHYSSLNILYWSIVDIVDSAIVNSAVAKELGQPFALNLKNDLYKICKKEIDEVVQLFYEYQYPNVKKDKILPFIKSLTTLFEDYERDPEYHLGLTSLKQILRDSEKLESLPFVMDEEDYILMSDLVHHYLKPIYTFRNSTHIFDKEASIESSIEEYNITYNGSPLSNFRFEDSKNDLLIQISDIFIGLVGKLSTFINSSSAGEIELALSRLDGKQLGTLDTYLDIINKADDKNKAFFHNTDSFEELGKLQMIFELRGKYY